MNRYDPKQAAGRSENRNTTCLTTGGIYTRLWLVRRAWITIEWRVVDYARNDRGGRHEKTEERGSSVFSFMGFRVKSLCSFSFS